MIGVFQLVLDDDCSVRAGLRREDIDVEIADAGLYLVDRHVNLDGVREEGQQLRYDYWAAFQDYAFQDTRFSHSFRRRKPSKEYWMSFAIGSSQCHIEASQVHKRSELSVQLYIDQDKDLFRSLYAMRETIEADAGLSFDWRELPNRKASRIVANKNVSFDDRDQWTEHFDWMIDTMLAIKTTFKKYL